MDEETKASIAELEQRLRLLTRDFRNTKDFMIQEMLILSRKLATAEAKLDQLDHPSA